MMPVPRSQFRAFTDSITCHNGKCCCRKLTQAPKSSHSPFLPPGLGPFHTKAVVEGRNRTRHGRTLLAKCAIDHCEFTKLLLLVEIMGFFLKDTTGLSKSSSISRACIRRASIISAGNSASTRIWRGSFRCSYPGFPLIISSYKYDQNSFTITAFTIQPIYVYN
ncbi:unnamed protein product [Trifolium pratense]|uniref:Uncharacterized protein n=1 Tax=Trifolium pratense TaxID=57577 RepID=A0ACB0J3D8_TRIPR|nr:unnamed protein product [Trifolium pratense]